MEILKKSRELFSQNGFEAHALEQTLRKAAEEMKIKAGQMFTPIRVAVTGKKNAPPLFETLDYGDAASSAVLILETAKAPPPVVVGKVAKATGLPAERLAFLYAPTQSLAGTVQIVSRSLDAPYRGL